MVYRIKDYISTESTEENVTDSTVEPLEQRIIDTVTSTDLNQEVEDKMEDIAESEFTLNNTIGEIDSAMESIDSLNTLISSLESIKENGGFTQESLILYNAFREDIYKKVGLPIQKTSLESFDDYSRHTLLQVSIEEDQNNKKSIWQKIWEFLSNLFTNFTGYLKSIFSVQESFKREIEKLKREISNKTDADFQGKVPENKRIALAKKVIINGNINIVENTKKFPEILKKVHLNEISKTTLSAIAIFKKDVDDALRIARAKSGEEPESHWKESIKKIVDNMLSLFPIDYEITSIVEGYEEVHASEELPGGSQLCVGYNPPSGPNVTAFPGVFLISGRFDEKIQPSDILLEIDNKKDAIDSLNNIIKTVDVWINISKESDKVSKEANNIVRQIKSAISVMNNDIQDRTNFAVKILHDLLKGYVTTNEKINNVMTGANKAVIDVIKLSMSKNQQNNEK